MANIHYKLPLDDEIDKDIIDWIDGLPRMKKGEMIRHAIRYYMAELSEGEIIKFPNTQTKVSTSQSNRSPEVKIKSEKKRPSFNSSAIKGN